MKLTNIYILALFLFGIANVNAQTDMVMMRPIDFSPGMVGNKEKCISFSTRNINLSADLISYNTSLSYEFLSQKLKGGIGISYTSSMANYRNPDTFIFGKASSQRLNFVYAPKMVLFENKLQFSPFIKLSAMHINKDAWRSAFEQDIMQMPIQLSGKYNVLSTSTGFLVNQRRWFFGAELYGVNTFLMDSSYHISEALGFKYQTGVFINFTKNRKYGVSLILAQDYPNDEGKLFNANNSLIGVFKLNKINVLLSYHSDHFGLVTPYSTRFGLGYQPTKNIKIGYSIGFSEKSWEKTYDHQIGFQYIIQKKDNPFFGG